MRGNGSSQQTKSQQRKKLAQKHVFNIYNQKMKILYNNMNNNQKQLNQQNPKKPFLDYQNHQNDIKRTMVNMLHTKGNPDQAQFQ